MTAQPVNMGEDRVMAVLLKLGGPAMLSMFFQNLYSLADTVFVAQLGTDQLAALSLCIPLLYISLSLGKGISVGTTVLMSHAKGSGDAEKATRISRQALPLTLLILFPFCLFAIPAVNQSLFSSFGVDSAVMEHVDQFIFWLSWTFPVMGFTMLCEGIFLSYGDSKTPMKAMIVGNVLNLCLDPFLIFTCDLGIAGASLASLIGWSISGLIMFTVLKKRKMSYPRMSLSTPKYSVWREIIAQGTPVATGLLVIPVSLVGLNYILSQFGPAYIGAWNVSSRMEQMLILPLYGLSCSLIPFTGFNMGQRSPERIHEAVRLSLIICYAILIPCVVLLWLGAEDVIELFGSGPEVLKLSTFALRVALMGYLFIPLELIMMGLAQGMRNPGYSLLITACRTLLLRIPIAILFGFFWEGKGVYISHPLSMFVTGMLSLFLLRHLLRMIDTSCTQTQTDPS